MGMETVGVDESAQRIGRTGEQLAADWGAAKAAIAGAEGAIGAGRLADAFRGTYLPASAQVRTNADTFPPRFTDLAVAGSQSSETYLGSDTAASQLFGAVAPPGDPLMVDPPGGG
jgi:hypothetical protein